MSVPTHQTVDGIKEDWAALIASGIFTLGEPCHPHTLKKYVVRDGEIQHWYMVENPPRGITTETTE